jgi:TPR repeat protein
VTFPQVVTSAPASATSAIAGDDKAMLERADGLLREGDVAAARLLYTRLARKSVAEGAFGMAKTFDPAFLRRVPTAGLHPDLANAREWYRKAEQLGSSQAKIRLSELTATGR